MDAMVHELEADPAGELAMTEREKVHISLLRGVRRRSRHERTSLVFVAGTLVPPTGLACRWIKLSDSWSDRAGVIASKRLIRGIYVTDVADLRGPRRSTSLKGLAMFNHWTS